MRSPTGKRERTWGGGEGREREREKFWTERKEDDEQKDGGEPVCSITSISSQVIPLLKTTRQTTFFIRLEHMFMVGQLPEPMTKRKDGEYVS